MLAVQAKAQVNAPIRFILNHEWGREIQEFTDSTAEYTVVAQYLDDQQRPLRIICLANELDAWVILHVYLTLRDHLENRYETLLDLCVTAEMRDELNRRKTLADQILPYAANIIAYAKADKVLEHIRLKQVDQALSWVNRREANTALDELVRSFLHTADLDYVFATKAIDWTVRINPNDRVSRHARALIYFLKGMPDISLDESALAQMFNHLPAQVLAGTRTHIATRYFKSYPDDRSEWGNHLTEQAQYRAMVINRPWEILLANDVFLTAETCLTHGKNDHARIILAALDNLDPAKINAEPLSFEGDIYRGSDTFFRLVRILNQRDNTQELLAKLFEQAMTNDHGWHITQQALIGLNHGNLLARTGGDAPAIKALQKLLRIYGDNPLIPPDIEIIAATALAKLETKQGDYPSAIRTYKRAIDRLNTAINMDESYIPHLAFSLYDSGILQLKQGQLEVAESQFKEATVLASKLSRDYPKKYKLLLARTLQQQAGIRGKREDRQQQRKLYDLAARTYANAYQLDPSALRNEYLSILEEHKIFYKNEDLDTAWRQTIEQIAYLHPIKNRQRQEVKNAIQSLFELSQAYYDEWNVALYKKSLDAMALYASYLEPHEPDNALYTEIIARKHLGNLALLTGSNAVARTQFTALLDKQEAFRHRQKHSEDFSIDIVEISAPELNKRMRKNDVHGQFILGLISVLNQEPKAAQTYFTDCLQNAKANTLNPLPDFESRHFAITCMIEFIERLDGKERISDQGVEKLTALGQRQISADPTSAGYVENWKNVVFKLTSARNSKGNRKYIREALYEQAYFLHKSFDMRGYLPHFESKRTSAQRRYQQGDHEAAVDQMYQCLTIATRLPPELSAMKNQTIFGLVSDLAQHFDQHSDVALAKQVMNTPPPALIAESSGHPLLRALCMRQFGRIAQHKGDLDDAFKHFKESRNLILNLDAQDRMDGQLILSLIYHDLATIYRKAGLGDVELISNTHAKSLAAFEAWQQTYPNLHIPSMEEAFFGAGIFYIQQEDFTSAIWTFEHARKYFKQHRPLSPENAIQHIDIHFGLAQAYDGLMNASDAIREANTAEKIIHGAPFKNTERASWILAMIHLIQAQSSQRMLLFERSLLFAEQAEQVFNRCSPSNYPNLERKKIRARLAQSQAFIGQKRYPQAESILTRDINALRSPHASAPAQKNQDLIKCLESRLTVYQESKQWKLAAIDMEEIIRLYNHHAFSRDIRMAFYLRSLILSRRIPDYPASRNTLDSRMNFVKEHSPSYYNDPELGHMIKELRIPSGSR